MDDPRPLSPTALATYNRCPRAWYYRYVAGVKPPETVQMATGTAVHAALEAYLRPGPWPDLSPAVERAKRAESILDAWVSRTAPGTYVVEKAAELDLVPHGGLGRMGGIVDWSGWGPEGPWVIDHKTIANPRYWLTPEQCATDYQLTAYAAMLFPSAEAVTVGHIYYPPEPIAPAIVTGTTTREDMVATVRRFAEVSQALPALRAAPDADCVEAKTSGCWAYGGCFFASICSAAPASLRNRQPKDTSMADTSAQPLTAAQERFRARLVQGAGQGTPPAVQRPQEAAKAQEVASPTPATETPKRARKTPTPRPADPPAAAPVLRGLVDRSLPLVLVGCAVALETETLENWIPTTLRQAATHEGTDHGDYLLVPFNHGPRAVAAMVRAKLVSGDLVLPPVLFIPADHPVAPFLVPVLAQYGLVVRSVR